MRVRWSRRALAQLRSIREHIARDNPSAAADVGAAIEAAAASLGDFQRSGMPTSRPGYYTKLVAAYPVYRLFYRISPDEVIIVRVRDTRRHPLSE